MVRLSGEELERQAAMMRRVVERESKARLMLCENECPIITNLNDNEMFNLLELDGVKIEDIDELANLAEKANYAWDEDNEVWVYQRRGRR